MRNQYPCCKTRHLHQRTSSLLTLNSSPSPDRVLRKQNAKCKNILSPVTQRSSSWFPPPPPPPKWVRLWPRPAGSLPSQNPRREKARAAGERGPKGLPKPAWNRLLLYWAHPIAAAPEGCKAQLGGRPSQDSAGTAERRRRKTNLKRPKARLVRRGLVWYLGSIQQSATNHSILMQLSSKQIT